MLANTVPSAGTSVLVLLVLLAILAASSLTFAALVRRWTTHRARVVLGDWAREAGFRFHPAPGDLLPPPLHLLATQRAVIHAALLSHATFIARITTAAPPHASRIPSPDDTVAWNLLIRHLPVVWRPTGARPTPADRSILDLFSLSSFPLLGTTERFTVFGTDSGDARILSGSMARSLLPPDIGLLLHGSELLLDFSHRPFDPIEFERMLALADQLAQKLPGPT